MTPAADRAGVRTWDLRRRMRAESGLGTWVLTGLWRMSCGCWLDTIAHEMWEPCMAHESDGHLAVVSAQDGLHIARCLVVVCPWKDTRVAEDQAIRAAQEHWQETRSSS